MAICNLCPPGRREFPDTAMADHLRTAHPEVDEDGTRKDDDSSIVAEASLESAPEPTT